MKYLAVLAIVLLLVASAWSDARGGGVSPPRRPGGCLAPGESGICRAAFRRFAYNATSGGCEPFTWGGCQPQFNNFQTREACERTCNPSASEDPSPVSEDIVLKV